MVDPKSIAQTYREKAARCRRLARQTTDREIAERLVELAREFEEQAEKADKGEL
ncbi:MAG TPA: hypothetical protein VFX06_14045 [Stellaceae bacterium]|nr:hypothetical protein [Stellaceae bacterium]